MNSLRKVFYFYRDGFASMTIGKSLWLIIIIKVVVIFLVLKMFFFPDILEKKSTERGMSKNDYVMERMMMRNAE